MAADAVVFFWPVPFEQRLERVFMKRSFVLLGLILAFGCGLHAQAAAPVDVSVCDVVKNPAPFDGKIVRIKGTVVAGFDEFAIKDATDPQCGFQVNAIWLSYPQGSKAKSGPLAMVTVEPAHNFAGTYKAPARTPVTLDKSKEFKQFDTLLAQTNDKIGGICLGCARYEVTATLVGRLDTVADATLKRDASGKIVGWGGFGNMNAYPARLVLQSVSEVTPKEIDYSKALAITKGASPAAPAYGNGNVVALDPLDAAQKLVSRIQAGQSHDQAERALAVFPKSREQNGVSIVYAVPNEVAPEEAGTKDSPDGILYNCVFNRERLQGDSMTVALYHVGQHVADLRSPKPGNEAAPLFIQENDGWVVTSVAAVYDGQKFLTLPGGYLFWNASWAAADRNLNMDSALKDFLANEAMLSK
jgi:hypothetical protein